MRSRLAEVCSAFICSQFKNQCFSSSCFTLLVLCALTLCRISSLVHHKHQKKRDFFRNHRRKGQLPIWLS
ncbi:unnamed protein product, partial [Coccothraustes coccothraustes]